MVRLLHHSDLEGVYDAPDRVGRLVGTLRALDGPDAVVCGSGDDLGPGVLALVERGRQALDLFEAAGTTVETFGNHDFDFGVDRTLELVEASTPDWLSANVRRGDVFGASAGVSPTATRDVDGTRVGFLGLTDPDTAEINPRAAPLSFADPVPATRRAAATLRERGADHVVVLSHLGAGDDALARETDVDAVLGGHVHSRRAERVDGTLLTRPGAGGHAVAEVDLRAGEARLHEVADAPVDADAADRFRGRARDSGLTETVAHAPEPMARDEATTYGGECRVGNFVAEAFRAVADADVGLVNGGGIRAGEPLAGPVSRGELVGLMPFEEPLTVARVSGERLRAALETGHGEALDYGEPDWWHVHVAGARLTYDVERGVVRDLTVGGEPVDPDATYEVALPDFLLRVDAELRSFSARDRYRELPVQYEALVEYAREHGVTADLDGRVRLVSGEVVGE